VPALFTASDGALSSLTSGLRVGRATGAVAGTTMLRVGLQLKALIHQAVAVVVDEITGFLTLLSDAALIFTAVSVDGV